MTHCYLIMPTGFKTMTVNGQQVQGYQVGCNILNVATTTDGRDVVSLNAVNEFPDVFRDAIDGGTFQVEYAWLSADDFPTPAPLAF